MPYQEKSEIFKCPYLIVPNCLLGYYYLLPYILHHQLTGFHRELKFWHHLQIYYFCVAYFWAVLHILINSYMSHRKKLEVFADCSGREWWSFTKFINCTRTLKLWFLMAHQFVINFTHDFTSFYPKSDAFVNILCYLVWSSCLTVPDLIQAHRHLFLLLGYICFFLL